MAEYGSYIDSLFEDIDAIIDLDFTRVLDGGFESTADINFYLVDNVDLSDDNVAGLAVTWTAGENTWFEILLQNGTEE